MLEAECLLGIADGIVVAAGGAGDASTLFTVDPEITEVVRMPITSAGVFLFAAWPGREAALARMESEDA